MNWLAALDLNRALRNVHADILGDWYRDPWGWPELDYVVTDANELLVQRLDEGGARRVMILDVPKENFVTRPAVVLDPLDRLCYQGLVDTLSKTLIQDLRGWAFGWRLPRKDPPTGVYAPNSTEWENYRQRLRLLGGHSSHALTTDVVSFFASVPIRRLMDDVRAAAGSGAIVTRLDNFLTSLQSVPGRSGLPQRCWASSVLAHFYFLPIDDLLNASAPQVPLFGEQAPAVVRWMDDMWVFSDSPMRLRLLQLDLQDLLNRRGLRLNAGKTDVLHGHDLAQQVLQIDHSAVDSALEEPTQNKEPLETMVAALLDQPEIASRTSLRFATTRIRKHKLFALVNRFVEEAMRLPHAADHLARLFRDSGHWKELQAWYISHVREYGRSLTWSTYHLGTMFPSSEVPGGDLLQFWAQQLSHGALPPLHAPLVAQRLAVWSPDLARATIRAALRQPAYEQPFAVRGLAIAGRTAGIPADETKQTLQQFRENELTLRYLESRKMQPPGPTADFAGA